MNPPTPGQMIKRARKAAGLTQAEIGQPANVKPQAVSKWERDETLPGRVAAAVIDDLLGFNGVLLAALGYSGEADERLTTLEQRVDSLDRELLVARDAVERLQEVVDLLIAAQGGSAGLMGDGSGG